jgi:hypothetical protein
VSRGILQNEKVFNSLAVGFTPDLRFLPFRFTRQLTSTHKRLCLFSPTTTIVVVAFLPAAFSPLCPIRQFSAAGQQLQRHH